MRTLWALAMGPPLGNDGGPVIAGLFYFYAAGTLVPKDTFTQATGSTTHTNPVELDIYGRAAIFLADDGAYDIVFKTPAGVQIWALNSIIAAAPAV